MPNVTKKSSKKAPVVRKKPRKFACSEVEEYLDKAVASVKKDIIPRIELLDKRDKDQYDSAKKIIVDAHALLQKRQEHSEKVVESVKKEIDVMLSKQDIVVENFQNSLTSLHLKFDQHVVNEQRVYGEINNTLKDMSEHGTSLARDIAANINHIKVNGGVYPLSEALQYIYKQHEETHQKLDEVYALVEPIQARRKWIKSTRELIQKNGLLKFIFTSKTGFVILAIVTLLILNTIMIDVFGIKLDLRSIFIWLSSISGKGG